MRKVVYLSLFSIFRKLWFRGRNWLALLTVNQGVVSSSLTGTAKLDVTGKVTSQNGFVICITFPPFL